MTDKELLEPAAKAAGYKREWEPSMDSYFWVDENGRILGDWNPLTDDGDALRLAVKLNIFNTRASGYEWPEIELFESHNDDPYAATRLAIVRAAAEIGRTK